MSKPHQKIKDPEQPGQIKTMFVMEGFPEASLVIEQGDLFRDEPMWFPDVSHALAWCRKNRFNFVYHPKPPNN